ncbi:SpoIIE family protein phosphatase [Streptomyces sp. ISID311]|uniref:ATP-binding SpoIIE family protein phosphatase n=1 Tax=Streptomyces sp. ISID311 TaxID=2601673 RepID=UPI0011BD3033|nr:SpoIIE family protein phosphatase [Streptomyces sp. ISID311]TXC96221.1 SpoIIE family protein phosphatase [Streptomyces sp. ISID311]
MDATQSSKARSTTALRDELVPVSDPAAPMPQPRPGTVRGLHVAFNAVASSLAAAREKERAAQARLELLHQASAAIGGSLDMEHTARALAEVSVPRFADFVTVDLATPVLSGEHPSQTPRAAAEMRRVAVKGTHADTFHSLITAPLTAHGTELGVVSFYRNGQSKEFGAPEEADAQELATRTGIAVDNALHHLHERTVALDLQGSLLPQRLPDQSALDATFRYLPADTQAGAGGDWFDVIPLTGARVALVLGDVVGHGVAASAAMGQLRTAVRTLADVDLPPDELLTHLDDMVLHLTGQSQQDAEVPENVSGLGTTCLYVVYDPISRHCTLATAGHPMPFVVDPHGRAHQVSGHVGPPLGVGGLPFENTELELAPSSVLALFSDGLVHSRHLDLEDGLQRLRLALEQPADSLEAAGDTVLNSLPAPQPHRADDVTLLLARTHALPANQVATWDLPSDPALVSHARNLASDKLEEWGITDSFVTELVISELVTNAVRYGSPPIQLRLIRDQALICEVSDANNAAPHMRRARTFDEGGRGLLLVAQLTQRWGTRPHDKGKTIWCEQTLPIADTNTDTVGTV